MKKLKSGKRFLYTAVSLLLSVFIIFYVLNMLFGNVCAKHNNTDGYKYVDYDVRLANTIDWYVTDYLAEQFEIEDYLMISTCYMDFELRAGEKSTKDFNFIAVLPSDSFDKMRKMIMHDELVRDCDEDLLKQEDAMALSASQAYLLAVDVGDKVEFNQRTYTVALIYDAAVYFTYEDSFCAYVRAEAVDGYDTLFQNDPGVSITYLKFSERDKDRALTYIRDHYYQQHSLYNRYGDDFLNLATEEEIAEERMQAYNLPDVAYGIAMYSMRSDLIQLTTYTISGVLLVMALQIYENHKQLMINCKRYAIYRVLGYSRKRFFFNRFIKALLYGCVTCAAAVCILYKWRFAVVSKLALYEMLVPIPFVILIVAIAVSLIALYEFRDLMLVSILKSEE